MTQKLPDATITGYKKMSQNNCCTKKKFTTFFSPIYFSQCGVTTCGTSHFDFINLCDFHSFHKVW